MSTTQTENQTNHVPSAVVEDDADTAARAFIAKIEALATEGNNLGYETLRVLTIKLGRTANKFGRPDIAHYVAFVLAMSARNLSVNSRLQLCQIGNAEHFHNCKPVFTVRNKCGAGDGSVSYKLNMPAQMEAEIV